MIARVICVCLLFVLPLGRAQSQCYTSSDVNDYRPLTGTVLTIPPNGRLFFLAILPNELATAEAHAVYLGEQFAAAGIGAVCGSHDQGASWIWTNRSALPANVGLSVRHFFGGQWTDVKEGQGTQTAFGANVFAYGYRPADPPPGRNPKTTHTAAAIVLPMPAFVPLGNVIPSPTEDTPPFQGGAHVMMRVGFPSQTPVRLEILESTGGPPSRLCTLEGSEGASADCFYQIDPSAQHKLTFRYSRRGPTGNWGGVELVKTVFANNDLLIEVAGTTVGNEFVPIAVVLAVVAN